MNNDIIDFIEIYEDKSCVNCQLNSKETMRILSDDCRTVYSQGYGPGKFIAAKYNAKHACDSIAIGLNKSFVRSGQRKIAIVSDEISFDSEVNGQYKINVYTRPINSSGFCGIMSPGMLCPNDKRMSRKCSLGKLTIREKFDKIMGM